MAPESEPSVAHCPQQQRGAVEEADHVHQANTTCRRKASVDAPPGEGAAPDNGMKCDEARRRDADCSNDNNEEDPTKTDGAPCNGNGVGEDPIKYTPVDQKTVARICGPSRARCGYCCGKRLHVLGVRDGHNKVVVGDASEKKDGDATLTNGSNEDDEIESEVNESNTSKSYGLLFDRLPYDTYEEMINRGWRRSGNHLYRPHNFESCCPSISIRLDVLKFASRCRFDVIDKSSHVEGGDLSRAILVRGSKSQRKVGRNLLRALERYNAKCTNGQSSAPSKEKPSAYSCDDLAHASHVATMQPCDGDSGLVGSGGPKEKIATAAEESGLEHQHKKSRRRSPDRDINTQNGGSSVSKHQATAKAQSNNELSLQSVLDQLSGVVYQKITEEAMKAVTSKPKWAWWNDANDGDMTVPKWGSFKIAQPKSGSKDQRGTVTASTSACAAASGRSRGAIVKSLLVRTVVDSLEGFRVNSSQRYQEMGVEIKDISYHEKSGHVHVTFGVPPSAGIAAVKATPPSKGVPRSRGQSGPSATAHGVGEPIAEFITRHQTMANKLNNLSDPNFAKPRDPYRQQRFLTVRSIPAHESSLQLEVHQLFCRYQTAIHGDFDPFFGGGDSSKEKDHSQDYAYYRMKEVPGFLDVDIAYSHLDEAHRLRIKSAYVTFYRFLCETPTPVAREDISSGSNSLDSEDGYDVQIPYGTYHQQYRLSTSKDAFDGPLIAVGVVDILPQSLSSVYAFYDPLLSSALELGKYTALREIEWVRRASQFRPDLHYYYLGYYIHSCPKMTYKAEYKPSELLCPVILKWVDFGAAKTRLEECSPTRHCCALYTEPPPPERESDTQPSFTIDDITLDIGGEEPHHVQLGMLNRQGRAYIEPHVKEFVDEVGLDLCRKLIIKLR